MIKIEIKNVFTGSVIFEYKKENNNIRDTVTEFIRQELEKGKPLADLRYADLRYTDLNSANLRSADLSYADLSYANLNSADLSYANLNSADLSYADLNSVNLSYAKLRYADLNSVNLSYANLDSADLSSANLNSADLNSANLRSADLSLAVTDKRYLQVSCIGSSKRKTTYCFNDDIIWCGCFKGSLSEFEYKVKSIYNENETYSKEYTGFINYIKSLR